LREAGVADQPRRVGEGGEADPERFVVSRAGGHGGTKFGRRVVIVGVDDCDGVFRLRGWSSDEWLGWSAHALRCAPFWEWVHPDDQERLDGLAEQVLRSGDGRFLPVELRMLGRDRQYWWTRWHLWSAASDPPRVCASGADHVGRDGVRGLPMATFRWNIDDDSVVWSAELLDMFDLAVGPPASYADFLRSVDDDDRAAVDRAVRWSLLSGDPYVADFRSASRRAGRDRWFHAAGRVEPAGGNRPCRLLGIVKDLNP
jgi:hypothetical protein